MSIPANTITALDAPPTDTDYMLAVVADAAAPEGWAVRQVPFALGPLSVLMVGALAAAMSRRNQTGQAEKRVIPVSASTYTLTATDLLEPTIINVTAAFPVTIFYPDNDTVSVPNGYETEIVQHGVGPVTLRKANDNVVVECFGTPTTAGQFASITARKSGTNTVRVVGDVQRSGAPVIITAPTIAGTGLDGGTLTLTPATASPDGSRVKQWRRIAPANGAVTNVGTDSLTYVAVTADVGNDIEAVEAVTNSFGTIAAPSNRIRIVAATAAPSNTGLPFIVAGSSNQEGGSVTVNVGNWTGTPTSYQIQRTLDGVDSGAEVSQAGTTLAYTIQSGEAGKTLAWKVRATNGGGQSALPASVSPNWPVAGLTPFFTAAPTITYSSTDAGATMTRSGGTTNVPATIRQKWRFFDPAGPYEDYMLPTQTNDTYVTNADDIGSQMLVDCWPENAAGVGPTVRVAGPTITRGSVPAPPPPPPAPPPGTEAGSRLSSYTPSGDITAVNDQEITGLSFANGNEIVIPPGVVNVWIHDNFFTGVTGTKILNQGTGTRIEYNDFDDCYRGILNHTAGNFWVDYNHFNKIDRGGQFDGHACETIYVNSPYFLRGNRYTNNMHSDVCSNYQSSRMWMTDNYWDVSIVEPSAAAFTMGDAVNGPPGQDNYCADNEVNQTGGVPCGVFGSNGNTILEYNCLKAGIQAYNYAGTFIGVTIRYNVIGPGSFTPDTTVLAQWITNITNSTNCALVPAH